METDALTFADITRDQLDAITEIRSRSFGHLPAANLADWRKMAGEMIDQRRFVGVIDGTEVVAAARILDFRHWWLGRQVPMAGIAGVVVSPEYRGRGVGSRLMRGVLGRCRELGSPITALYPATLPVYRYLGYEFGGARYRFTFAASELRTLGGKAAIRKGGPADASRLLELVAAVRGTGRESGMLGWPVDRVREWLEEDTTFCYVCPDGFVVYSWDGDDLRVDECVALSEATARALWATVGSGASIARWVHAYVGPDDPVHLLLREEAEKQTQIQRWMFRMVDAPAALAARGWAPGVSIELPLELEDPELPGNAGSWTLRVSDGTASLTPSEAVDGALRLNARGLAALYAGRPMSTLRRTGLATAGEPETDARLDATFACATPYALDFF